MNGQRTHVRERQFQVYFLFPVTISDLCFSASDCAWNESPEFEWIPKQTKCARALLRDRMNLCRVALLFLIPALLTGCAGSQIASRKRDRSAAYAALSQAHQRLADEGRIDVGMSSDGVYIAWGKPAMMVPTTPGNVTWIYRCKSTTASPARDSRQPPSSGYVGSGGYYAPRRGMQYVHTEYDCAEVNFEGNVVKNWRELPKPEN